MSEETRKRIATCHPYRRPCFKKSNEAEGMFLGFVDGFALVGMLDGQLMTQNVFKQEFEIVDIPESTELTDLREFADAAAIAVDVPTGSSTAFIARTIVDVRQERDRIRRFNGALHTENAALKRALAECQALLVARIDIKPEERALHQRPGFSAGGDSAGTFVPALDVRACSQGGQGAGSPAEELYVDAKTAKPAQKASLAPEEDGHEG